MKVKYLIIITLLFSTSMKAITILPDSSLLKYIENKVTKNILIFRIKTTLVVENDLHDKFLKLHISFFDVLPDNGCKLLLEVKKINIQYPDTSITLYSIFKKYDQYECDTVIIEKNYSYFYSDRYFLVGINKGKEIKFISGNFFLSSISNDFKLDIKTPNSFIKYLELKTYYLQTKGIKFIKKNKKRLLFEAYSKELDKTVNIAVPINDIENIIVN